VVRSSYRITTALQASLGAAALAASEIGRQRGGPAQTVTLDARAVALESTGRFTLDGIAPQAWDPLSGFYACAGDTWVRVHTNFAHHREGLLALLGLAVRPTLSRDDVAAALFRRTAFEWEDAAADGRALVVAVRSPEAWQQHPQAAAVARLPLIDVDAIGAADALAWPSLGAGARPLAGLRVLDLTRVLAGPVAGRTLAAYGADVMLVNSPHLPNIDAIADTSRGKLSVHLDLRTAAARATLWDLVHECDVLLDAYRPGALAALGFAPEGLATYRPGIVYASLSAYGHAGPWAERRGFDSLVQSVSGMNVAEARAFGRPEPRALPLPALDYGAGYLLALGVLAALRRQRREGGSWRVRVALARVGHWLQAMGRMDDGPRAAALSFDDAMEESDSGFGRLAAVKHAVQFSHTPAGWQRPSTPPGTHPPAWPSR
jgi:hypothetical protein